MTALEVKDLYKKYPSFTLDHVDFSVEEGNVVGFIGRNGAGKTTTIKSLLGLVHAEGEVSIFGKEYFSHQAECKAQLGYVGGGFRFYAQKKLSTVVGTYASFYPEWDEGKYDSYLKKFNLDGRKKVKELSEGMKVKFGLALALSHGAKLLVLDEPTSGLDPLSREELCELILSLVQDEGISVFFSTHVTSDLEAIADRVVYISNGKIVMNVPIEELKSKYKVVSFTAEPKDKNGLIGCKRVKHGYEALALADYKGEGRTATLDEVMTYLERGKDHVDAS